MARTTTTRARRAGGALAAAATLTGLLTAGLAAPAPAGASALEPPPGWAEACAGLAVAGHRGTKHYSFETNNENTIVAFEYAAAAGVDAVEADLWRLPGGTASDAPTAVTHDPTWKRTIDPATLTGVPAVVASTTAAQVARLRTRGGEAVPTYAELVAWAGTSRTRVYLDLKNVFTLAQARAFKAAADRVGADIVMVGGSQPIISPFRSAGFAVGVKGKPTWTYDDYVRARVSYMSINPRRVTDELVDALQATGMTVSTNATNPGDYEAAVGRGYDQIIAQVPTDLLAWRDGGCPQAPAVPVARRLRR